MVVQKKLPTFLCIKKYPSNALQETKAGARNYSDKLKIVQLKKQIVKRRGKLGKAENKVSSSYTEGVVNVQAQYFTTFFE